MADTIQFGISRLAGEFVDSVKVKGVLNVAERKGSNGDTVRVFGYDKKTEVSIAGGGACPLALGNVTNHGVQGIEEGGVFLVKETEAEEVNDNFNSFNASATHYPNATYGEAATQPAPAGGGA